MLLIFLSIVLSLDALGVGISYGVRKIAVPCRVKLVIGGISFVFMALMLCCGNAISKLLSAELGSFIGAMLLLLIGIYFIIQTKLKSKKPKAIHTEKRTLLSLAIKSLGICIQIIAYPESGDIDKSGHLDIKEAIYLGTALSLDSLGAGIGAALSSANDILLYCFPLIVGVVQVLFLSVGIFFGKRMASIRVVSPNFWSYLSGVLLIGIAVIRIFIK